jgi:hypothetical protein
MATSGNVAAGLSADGSSSNKDGQGPGAPSGLTATVAPASNSAQPSTAIEFLGTETIQGFVARGSRVTQTTAGGAMGNNGELVSTRESWQTNASGIGLTVREVDEDPVNGKRITELEKFSLGAPDPVSFQPPKGYEIVTREIHPAACQQSSTASQ